MSTSLSRPTYATLEPQTGTEHIFIADSDGAAAILDMAMRTGADFFASAHIIYITGGQPVHANALTALKAGHYYEGPSLAAAMPRLRQVLANAHMGTRIYLAGAESLIGQTMQTAVEAGFPTASILTEHRGSKARRVQCVHCKGITENVTTQPVTCVHCGLVLLVRDHYSRRLAAFQGVCINAEDPADIPAQEEMFR